MPSLANGIHNIAIYIDQFELLIRAVCYGLGIILVIQSCRLAIRRTELGTMATSWPEVIVCFVSGITLLALPLTLSVILNTLFGTSRISSPNSLLAYTNELLTSELPTSSTTIVNFIIRIIQFIGIIAIVRAILIFNTATGQGKSGAVGAGFTFLIAGGLALNFSQFWIFVIKIFES